MDLKLVYGEFKDLRGGGNIRNGFFWVRMDGRGEEVDSVMVGVLWKEEFYVFVLIFCEYYVFVRLLMV